MTPQDYKILKVGTPKSWSGQYGEMVTYPLLLEETGEEAIEQNKKPDSPAPKEGDTIYGHIERTAFGAKFKADKKLDGSYSGSGSKIPSQGAEKAYMKDVSDLPVRFLLELLKYYDVQSLFNSPKYTQMVHLAQSLNDDAMAMINANRGSLGHPTKETQVDSLPAPASIKDKLDKGFTEDDEIHG